ncbi:MAG: zinc-dependent metalloprotease [Chitinophagales bacterium]
MTILMFMLVCFNQSLLQGQNEEETSFCYTSSDSPNLLEGIVLDETGGDINVRLYFHIIRRADGTDGRNPSDILDAMEVLEEAYTPHDIFFKTACIDYIDSDTLYNISAFWCALLGDCGFWYQTDFLHDDGIDIFVLDEDAPNWSGGLANGVFSTALAIGGTWLDSDVDVFKSHIFSHEIGHCLGLFHTHHGTCEIGSLPEMAVSPSNPNSNCQDAGDFVCDTPASPRFISTLIPPVDCNNPVWNDSCDIVDEMGNPYMPLADNIMSYAYPACFNDLTHGQGIRARNSLLTVPILQACIIQQPFITDSDLVGGTLPPQETIWNQPTYVVDEVIVPAGAKLIINNTTVGFVSETIGITVEKGGILQINNATLQVHECGGDYWRGIRVEGDRYKNHPDETDYLLGGTVNHGVVIVQNNSTIRDALKAIHAPDNFDVLGGTLGGGIVHTIGNNYINNKIDIQLDWYQGAELKPKYFQKSVIRDNIFKTESDWFGAGTTTPTHIKLRKAGTGLDVANNNFQGNLLLPETERGIGIHVIRTHLKVSNNSFSALYKGIDAYHLPNAVRQLHITGNQFVRTLQNITLTNGVFAKIIDNGFSAINNAGTAEAWGIFAHNSAGLQIIDNEFHCNADLAAANLDNAGIVLQHSGYYTNLISDNEFAGAWDYANLFKGDNSHITIECNTYADEVWIDWKVDSGTLQNQGKCELPTPEETRRNSFHTPSPSNSYNIDFCDNCIGINENGSINLGPNSFEYVGQIGFRPTYNNGNVIIDDDCDIESPHCGFDNEPCAADPDCLQARILEAETAQEKVYYQTLLLQAHLEQENDEAIKQDLISFDDTEANKMLTGTYESETQIELAWQYLDLVPEDTESNIAFKAVYTDLLNGIDLNGSGKMGNQQEVVLRENIQSRPESVSSALAQSVIAAYTGESFEKVLGIGKNNDAEIVDANNNILSIQPNPAQNELHIQVLETDKMSQNMHLQIYNLQGQLLQNNELKTNNTSISLQALPNGVYFCRLQNGKQLLDTEKLIIIH